MEKNESNEKNESKLEEDKIKGRILLGVLIVTILFIAIIFINLLIKNPEENILNNNVLNDVYNKYGIPSIDKPVIYLYPEEKTEVKTEEEKSLTELKNLAKEKGIKGYTKMTKEELEKALDEEETKEKEETDSKE